MGAFYYQNINLKIVPQSSAMILPDDSKIPEEQRIRWDDTLKRYVGAVEEEVAPPPPPSNRVADVPPAAAVIATAVAAPPHLAAAYATPAVAEDAAATAPAVSPVAYPYVAMNSMPTLPTPTAVPSSSMRRGQCVDDYMTLVIIQSLQALVAMSTRFNKPIVASNNKPLLLHIRF